MGENSHPFRGAPYLYRAKNVEVRGILVVGAGAELQGVEAYGELADMGKKSSRTDSC
jgi:NADH dehydrogenase FAD-containing subunit